MTKPVNTREIILGILWEITEEERYSHVVIRETLEKYQILSKGELVIQNKYFTMEKIYCAADRIITTDDWKIAIVLDGPEKGKEYFLTADSRFKAGQTVLLCSQGRE